MTDFGSINEEIEAFNADHSSQLPPTKRLRLEYTCNDCQATYKQERALTRHKQSDTHRRRVGLPPAHRYLCSEPGCHTTFSRDYDRARHEREKHQQIKRLQSRHIPSPGTASVGSSEGADLAQEHLRQSRENGVSDTATNLDECRLLLLETEYGCLDDALVLPPIAKHSPPQTSSRSFYKLSNLLRKDLDVANSLERASNEDSSIGLTKDGTVLKEHARGAPVELTKSKSPWSVDLPMRTQHSRSSLIRWGANLRPKKEKDPPPCPLCYCSFGKDLDDVREHMQRHMQDLHGEHICSECDIGFRDAADLELHQFYASSKQPHCGFAFEHNRPCDGHHRPNDDDVEAEYSDRFKLWYFLKDWEQAVLQLFMDGVREMLSSSSRTSNQDCWSVGAIFRRSIISVTNLGCALARKSTPGYIEYESKLEIEDIRRSMQARLSGVESAQPSAKKVEQQLGASPKSHDAMKAQSEEVSERDEIMKREYEEKLTAHDDYQAAVKYLRGTENLLSKMKQELQRVKDENRELKQKLDKVKDEGSHRGTPDDLVVAPQPPNNFRTSLLMPLLAARFDELREQDDWKMVLDYAGDDETYFNN